MSNHLNQPLLPAIPGYILTEELYLGSHTAVYRALTDADTQAHPVVIKVLRSPHPSFKALVRFRNQYIIAKNLPIEGIVRPLTLESWAHSYALVMEDVGGIALSEYLQRCGSLPLGEVLAIALQMADILHHLSQHRVLHKDIKPANILIHPDTHQIWLTDFSLASLLSKETQDLQNPGSLAGTLAYIAPEQTGRMNRRIDYRVDFYGLGVTLYELLTGELPFQSHDALALIHSHIAKTPVLPDEAFREGGSSNPIPKGLADIVLKLMAKNPENRYQSALGLKHDLQKCLTQREAFGRIQAFELGQADGCDRFLIPEKLYGRETEVETLLDAFERVSQGSAEFVLVAGFSGIGKTAVVNEVHKPITREKGYFIKGKFDQFHQNIPLSAFLQAFRSLIGQLLGESDVEVAHWKDKILTAVGESGQVLIEVIPELAQLIGKQPAVPELSGTASQDRFYLLFGRFIQLFTTPEHPLVIFLDDLQWADLASLTLLKLLMDESQVGYLLVLGAYRDNEVFPAHPLMLTLNELQQQASSVHTLILNPLLQTDINQLVADTLRCKPAIAVPLSELVYQKTQGNPFFTAQLLYGLYSDGHIHFDPSVGSCHGSWQCDLTQLKQLALTNDVVEFMVERLQKLPEKTQDILKLASCISNCFDLQTLSIICNRPRLEIAADLWRVLYEGLVIPESEVYKFFQGTHQDPEKTADISVAYRFLHDRVQQAAYCLMDEDTRLTTHLHIGQSLLTQLSDAEVEDKLFDIVNHWNTAKEILAEPAAKKQLCQLNLRAGRKATTIIAYDMAEHYAAIAVELLPPDSWQIDYELTLEIYNLCAKATYLNGHFTQVDHWTAILVKQSKDLLDTIDAYEIKILATVAQKQSLGAIKLGLKILKKLEIVIPAEPTPQEIQQTLADIEKLVPKTKIDSLVSLPNMIEPRALSALKILNCIAVSVYLAKPQLFPLIVLAQVKLSILFGNAPISAGAYARYSLLLCGRVNDIETGYAFGQLALALSAKFNHQEISTRVLLMVGALTLPWKQHLRTAIPLLKQAYLDGIESGSLEAAAVSHYYESQSAYLIGISLGELEAQTRTYSGHIKQAKQTLHFHNNELLRQVICNLLGHVKEPCVLTGAAFDEGTMLPQFHASHNLLGLFCFHLHKLMLCYWFEQIDSAVKHSQEAVNYLSGVTAQATVPVFYFYASLACLSCCAANGSSLDIDETSGPAPKTDLKAKPKTDPKTSPSKNLERSGPTYKEHPLWHWTQESIEKLRDWAGVCPMNFQHRLELVDAKQYAIAGNKLEAIEAYDRAIAGAKRNQYIQEEALANELAAKFYLAWGKERVAAGYLQEAYDCYTQWGAKAKTDDLEKRYPQLLQSILQPRFQEAERASYSLDSLNSVAPSTISVHSSSNRAKTSTRDINDILDLSAILKSAQALSESIDLDELHQTLAQMMMQTSGAERLALLLPNAVGAWQISVTAIPDSIQLGTTMLSNHTDLPIQLIQYVQQTQEILAIDGLEAELPIVDPYLQQSAPRSVLCLPLLHQHQLKGLLYLEHQSMVGIFHRDRITVLNFLCTQAAIALDNAQLYQKAQTTAQQLEASLSQLQRSEHRFRNLAANVPGVIYQVSRAADGTSSILYISPDCEDLFELSAEAMRAGHCSLRDFEYPEDRPVLDKILANIRQTLEPFNHEFRIVTPLGSVKWV
ncbi:MAG: AAA family ATPase, partial [Cyanobacteria bacterium P01_F01_bin.86]